MLPAIFSTRFGALLVIGLSLAALCLTPTARGQLPSAFKEGKKSADVRLGELKDLNGYFPMQFPASKEAWEARKQVLRRQILVSQGLWPLPTKTPLNAVVHGLIDQGDYTVEKVYFESFPGFFVTGSLFRPKTKGPHPAVLCPHGHFAEGRFHDAGRQRTRQEIVIGAERFENGGRSPLQARCVQLARMGCVVFHYDMLGYADSQQLSFDLVHRFAKQRPEMNAPDAWGLYSPLAENHLQSVMGLQTWNSIRSLDFVLGLPDIDSQRIAVTGASGGGTQTFLLCGVDDRPTLSFPAVMVSTAMQGGCTCENSTCLRVNAGNIDFAALFAPKPLGMTTADDWTREMTTKGYPDLQKMYDLLGATKNVSLTNLTHFKHNYNYVSRSAMYAFVNKHFKLGLEEPVVEEDYPRLEKDQLTVWDAKHPAPEAGPQFERKLLQYWRKDADAQLTALTPKAPADVPAWRQVVGGGFAAVLQRELPPAGAVEWENVNETDSGDYIRFVGLIKHKAQREELPALFLLPKAWNKQVVIWLTEQGKAGLVGANGEPTPDVLAVVKAGAAVCGVDLLYQGELSTGEPLGRTRRVNNEREAAAYTFGYNHTVFAQRVHDVLTAASLCINYSDKPDHVDLVALDRTAPIAAAARATAGFQIRRAALHTGGFRFAGLEDIHDPHFLPGAAKYGDLPALLALALPADTWLSGESQESAALPLRVYQADGNSQHLSLAAGLKAEEIAPAAIKYVLQP